MKKIILLLCCIIISLVGCRNTSVPTKKTIKDYYDYNDIVNLPDGENKIFELSNKKMRAGIGTYDYKIVRQKIIISNKQITLMGFFPEGEILGKSVVIQDYTLPKDYRISKWGKKQAGSEVITKEKIYGKDDKLSKETNYWEHSTKNNPITKDITHYNKENEKTLYMEFYKNGNVKFSEAYFSDGKVDREENDENGELVKQIYNYGTDKEFYYLTSEEEKEKYTAVDGNSRTRRLKVTFRRKNGEIYFSNKFKYFDNKYWHEDGKYKKEEYNSKGQLAWEGLYYKGPEGDRDETFYYYYDNNMLNSYSLWKYKKKDNVEKKSKFESTDYYFDKKKKSFSSINYEDNGEIKSAINEKYDLAGNITQKKETVFKDKGNLIERRVFEKGKLSYTTKETKENGYINYYEEKGIDGKIKKIINYNRDSSGKLKGETCYEANKNIIYTMKVKDKKNYYYSAEGELTKITEVNKDYRTETKIFENGKLKTFSVEKEKTIDYDENGMVQRTIKFEYRKDGVLLKKQIFDSNNKLVTRIDYHEEKDLRREFEISEYVNENNYKIDEVKVFKGDELLRKGKKVETPKEMTFEKAYRISYEYEIYEDGLLSGYTVSTFSTLEGLDIGILYYNKNRELVKEENYGTDFAGVDICFDKEFSRITSMYRVLNYFNPEEFEEKVYDYKSNLKYTSKYEDGEYVSRKYFDENGLLTSLVSKFDDRNNETELTFYEDGMAVSKVIRVYDDRNEIIRKEFYTLQDELKEILYIDETGYIKKEYYKDENVMKEEEVDPKGAILQTKIYKYDADGFLVDIVEE